MKTLVLGKNVIYTVPRQLLIFTRQSNHNNIMKGLGCLGLIL